MTTFRLDPAAWAKIHRLAEQARRNVLDDIADDARRYVPVDTGALLESIRVEGNQVVAGNDLVDDGAVDYAGYVELGTSRMDAQPYLRPALYRKRNIRVDGAR